MREPVILSGARRPTASGAALYQMAPCVSSQMMGYLLRTRGGKLFCIDGGTRAECEAFLDLARQVSGCLPGQKLHIDGWFLTHPHFDHVDAFLETVEKHLSEVQIDRVYYNFPSTAYQETYEAIYAYTCHDFEKAYPLFASFAQVVQPGQRLDFGDVRFDVLACPDESIHENTGNNSSVVLRASLEGQTLLFLADAGVEEGEAMLRQYGQSLRADYVQMAHHGQNGVSFEVYRAISPAACLWSTPEWLWQNDSGAGYGSGPWKTFSVRCFMQDLGVSRHFIAKDGVWEIPLGSD